MFPPTSGDAMMAGHLISSDMSKIRHHIGLCPQSDILYDELTVREHLLLFASIKGMKNKARIEANIGEMMACVGLKQKMHEYSKNLSGGQKRRLSVAIALLGDSKIVFLGMYRFVIIYVTSCKHFSSYYCFGCFMFFLHCITTITTIIINR